MELEALRRQLESVPDADSLAALKGKAEQFDSLASQLPEWRQKLSTTFEAEQAALRQQLEAQQQQLSAKERETTAMQAFIAGGGEPKHWGEFYRLIGETLQADESGALICTAAGNPQPLQDALKALAADATSIWPSFFRPVFGTGSGGRSVAAGRTVSGPNLHNLSTSDKFRAGFLSR